MSPKSKRPDRRPPSADHLTRTLLFVALIVGLAAAALGVSLFADRSEGGAASDAVGAQASQTPTDVSSAGASSASPSPVPVTPPPCVPPQDWTIHLVKEGDTLSSLALQYDADVETLKLVNCLKDDIIKIDEELYVPAPPGAKLPPTAQPLGASAGQADAVDEFVNIILLGSDKRKGDSTWRTDTMIVASVDTRDNVVRVLSIPRDLWVSIPGHGYDRINTADEWGELAQAGSGPEVVKRTIEESLGIPIQYYVRVDFQGFMKLIDAVGGVDVDVECPLPDIELTAGVHHMDGEQALLYARSRITTSDFDRGRRQRKILMALWAKARSMDIIPRIPALWRAMRGAFETDIPLNTALALARVGIKLSPSRIFSQSIGPWQVEDWVTPGGSQVLLPLPDKIQELLSSFYGPIDFDRLKKVSQTRVEVLNGSTRDQAVQLASTGLSWMGLQIAGTGIADGQDYAQSQVIVYDSDPQTAELVAQQLGLPPSALQYLPDAANPVDIRVVLGADYDPCAAR